MNNLQGIYIVQRKWDLIYLNNKKSQIEEYMNYYVFEKLLIQKFDGDKVKKILDEINSEKKLLIDFDKSLVKIIKEKEIRFIDSFGRYFTAVAAQDWLDNVEDYENNLYKGV